ncbi:MAG: hypothetical protein RL143_232 [Pseudomonadota bacterium]
MLLLSTNAEAHSFGAGTDLFASFIEGAKVILFEPITLFACLSLGLLLTLWRANGLLIALPYLIGATIFGFLSATFAPAWTITALLIIGTINSALAALVRNNSQIVVITISIATGFLCQFVALEGHAWMELSAAIYLGLIIGTYFCVVAASGLSQVLLERFNNAQWSRITLRVVASWLAAMQILMFAFQFVKPVAN